MTMADPGSKEPIDLGTFKVLERCELCDTSLVIQHDDEPPRAFAAHNDDFCKGVMSGNVRVLRDVVNSSQEALANTAMHFGATVENERALVNEKQRRIRELEHKVHDLETLNQGLELRAEGLVKDCDERNAQLQKIGALLDHAVCDCDAIEPCGQKCPRCEALELCTK